MFQYWFPSAPTCAADGDGIYKCSKCGDPKTINEPATGRHDWQNPVETVPGTCLYESTVVYKCTTCGGEDERVGSKNPNNHPAEIVVDGVCLGCYANVN